MALAIENILSFCDEVKNTFSSEPEKYQQFMDAVQKYGAQKMNMHEMLRRTSRLFNGQPHLVERFSQLLPPGMTLENVSEFLPAKDCLLSNFVHGSLASLASSVPLIRHQMSESASEIQLNHIRDFEKLLLMKPDSNLASIAKYGSYNELAFFDKVRRIMGNEETYLNFLRCVSLYTNNLVSGSELVDVVQPFLFKEPELTKEMRSLLGCHGDISGRHNSMLPHVRPRVRRNSLSKMEIDYASCRKRGISYRALPSSYEQPVCSGRTLPGNELCNEVLNDTWVSFPLWSEDTTFGNSKISQYEEFMYRSEDERFELDIVIDNVSATVVSLEAVLVTLGRMTTEEANAYQLDRLLGGTSETLQRKSIERIYGDKAVDMIEGLIKKPCVAVPIVLRRLRARLEEWREAQKHYNQFWREQCDKNYAKFVQSQATAFKQADARLMRTKTLLNEAETASEELRAFGDRPIGRPLEFSFADKMDMRDATSLIIHYLSYLPTGQTDDSFRVSQFLLNTLPQLIDMPSVSEPHRVRPNRSVRKGDEVYTIMYTNSSWYLFLRLYHLFCERLRDIRRLANGLQRDGHGPSLESLHGPKSYYEFILNIVRGMIEGTVDGLNYENELRKVLGTNAYVAFTVERILQNILQHLLGDDVCRELMDLYNAERLSGGTGGNVGTAYQRQVAELSYRRKAVQMLSDDYCFKIVFYKYEGRITMELIDTEAEATAEDQLLMNYRLTSYIERFVDPDQCSCEEATGRVFLTRNVQYQDPDDLATLSIIDNVHCQFAQNSFKMAFVAGSFSYLYRPRSLQHARQQQKSLSVMKRRKFNSWWSSWQSRHVTSDQERRCRDWIKRDRDVQSMRTPRGRGREK